MRSWMHWKQNSQHTTHHIENRIQEETKLPFFEAANWEQNEPTTSYTDLDSSNRQTNLNQPQSKPFSGLRIRKSFRNFWSVKWLLLKEPTSKPCPHPLSIGNYLWGKLGRFWGKIRWNFLISLFLFEATVERNWELLSKRGKKETWGW